MSWQEELVKTEIEKELYALVEPIFRERTSKGDESLRSIFEDLREEKDQKYFINKIQNGLTNPNSIVLALLDLFPHND